MVEVEYRAASGWSNFCRYVLLYPRWSRSWHRQAINRPFFYKPEWEDRKTKILKSQPQMLILFLISLIFVQEQVKPRTNKEPTSSSVNIPEDFCRMAYMQCATVTACFQLW